MTSKNKHASGSYANHRSWRVRKDLTMNRNNVLRIVCSIALLVSGLASLLSISGAAHASGNLVLNPSFEAQGSGGITDAANWTEGTNHTLASDKFHTGGSALHSTFTGTGTSTRTTTRSEEHTSE